MTPSDVLRWPVVIAATVGYLVWLRTTNPSDLTKRLVGMGWILFWFIASTLATRVADTDPMVVLLGVVVIVAASVLRGTSFGLYFSVFLGAFVAMMVLIFIVQGITHPNSWCPAPVHINSQGICRQS